MGHVNAWYGWRPDKPDLRDHYQLPTPRTIPLPAMVDLRDKFPPCWDQGDLGSCTAHAIAGALVYDESVQHLKPFMPSRLFIYYNERVMEGTVGEDAGAEIRDGIKSVAKQGVPDERLCPYDIARFDHKPTPAAYRAAKAHQALTYERVGQGLDSLKGCLADGFPFVFGFTVYDSFESKEVERTGLVPMPTSSQGVVGGHAVVGVGYIDEQRVFLCRNSWARNWGMDGYFTLPYDYVDDNNLADDFWVIKRIEGRKAA